MAGGLGSDFLDLLNKQGSDQSPTSSIVGDFSALMNQTPGQAFQKLDEEKENRITEAELDAIEERNRPGVIKSTGIAYESAKGEVKALGNAIEKTVNYLSPVLKEMALIAALPGNIGGDLVMREDSATKKLANDIKTVVPEIVKASPEIAGEIISDTAKSFGTEYSDETGSLRVDTDVAAEKFRQAPIETVGDWLILGAVLKKAMQVGGRAVAKGSSKVAGRAAREGFEQGLSPDVIKKATKGDKEFVKDMLKRMDSDDKAAAFSKEIHEVTRSQTPTIKDKLIDRRKALLNIKNKDLENPEFARNLGNRVKDNLQRLKLNEQGKLTASLSEIGDQTVDTELLFKKMANDLNDDLLLSKKNLAKKGPMRNKIKKGFKDTTFENFLDEVDGKTTVRELNEVRKRLDQSINFNEMKASDKALIIARRNIDDYIKGLDGAEEYKRQSSIVSNRLQPFYDKQKKIEKAGGGEAFGKRFFQSNEEVDLLLDALKQSDSIAAQSLRADIEMLDAWHTWNKMFSSAASKEFVPEFYAGMPMTAALRLTNKVSTPLAKSVVKQQVRFPALNKVIPSTVLQRGAQGTSVGDVFVDDIPSTLEDEDNSSEY